MRSSLARLAGIGGLTLTVLALAAARSASVTPTPPAGDQADTARTSADWLATLPDGAQKRQFIIDCTGCHQLTDQHLLPNGRRRTGAEWAEIVTRMLRFAGPTTPFPVISAAQTPERTSQWLAAHVPASPPAPAPLPARPAGAPEVEIREYMMPLDRDLPHDVAVADDGSVVITGMMSGRMYTLDPASGAFTEVSIPIERANPRAVEIDRDGNWWVVLGAPQRLARYVKGEQRWETHAVGMYPHSVALAPDGTAWVNGHFTRAPELIARVDRSGAVDSIEVPPHPELASRPGGPIPYEIRAAPNGTIWLGELQGNRLLAYSPRTKSFRTYVMPTAHSGPRRFDIDSAGVLWIPAYGTNELVRLDPKTGRFTSFKLPIADAVPYVARVDHASGAIWIGTSAADAMLRFDPHTRRFASYRLPTRGALVRHLAIDPRTRDVWIAYGAAPGPAARIARLSVRDVPPRR